MKANGKGRTLLFILCMALAALFFTVSSVYAESRPSVTQGPEESIRIKHVNDCTVILSNSSSFTKSTIGGGGPKKDYTFSGLVPSRKYYYKITDSVTKKEYKGSFTIKRIYPVYNSEKAIKKYLYKCADKRRESTKFYTNISGKKLEKVINNIKEDKFLRTYVSLGLFGNEKGWLFGDSYKVKGKKANRMYASFYYLMNEKDTKRFLKKMDAILKKMKGPAREKLCRLDKWLINHRGYDYTFKKFDPHELVLTKTGVCQAYAELVEALCYKKGIPCKFVAWENHSWDLVRIKGKWYHFDATWDVCWKPYGDYFGRHILKGRSDKDFKEEHKINSKFYKKYMPKSKFGKKNLSVKY